MAAAALAFRRSFLTFTQSQRDPGLQAQWERWLLRGIARCVRRNPAIVAGAPRFVTGAVQEYLAEADGYGEVSQEQAAARAADKRGVACCQCDDAGRCSACTVDEACEMQCRRMRMARTRAAKFVRRWLAGEWNDVGPAEPMPETKRSAS